MASSNHEVMVILSDGKPVTVIKSKDDPAATTKFNKSAARKASLDSFHKDDKESLLVTSSRQDKDHTKCRDGDEQVELRRLRSENQLLQDRIIHLEELMAAERLEKEDCMERLKKQITEMAANEQSLSTRIEHLTSRIEELQNIQEAHPQQPVNVEVQIVQDELVASKLREAEAKSSFKELQQKLHHLEKQWQLFHQEPNTVKEPDGKAKNQLQSELKEQVMALRIRETSLTSELNEIKQKLMELETQNHIFERQTKRQELEITGLLEKIGSSETSEKELNNTIKNLDRKLYDLESKQKEDKVMFKIREAEFCQTAAELKRRIAELEIENQELLTSAQLHSKDQDVKEMENRILELQDEILQMKLQAHDGLTAEDLNPASIMTESFISDSMCFLPTNFDSFIKTSGQTKDLLDQE